MSYSILYRGWVNMTRNKYCDVCGTELLSSRKRKRKDFSDELKPKSKLFRKKLTISILVALVLVSITVPAVYVPLARRAQFPGEIKLIATTTYTRDPEYDHLTLIMEAVNGIVSVDKIHLHSYDQEIRYQSMMVKQEYGTGQYILKTFMLRKGQLEDIDYGFSILIDFRYGKQWLNYHFEWNQ